MSIRTSGKETKNTMKWYVRACPNCHGDLHDDLQDPGWVTCFMCARSFPVSAIVQPLTAATPIAPAPAVVAEPIAPRRKRAA